MDGYWLAHVLNPMWIRKEKSDFETNVLALRLEAREYSTTAAHDKEPIASLYPTP